MSRLDELIAELCPDGVEYKTLGEIAIDMYRGSGITRKQISSTGTPCVRYGEIYTTYGRWFEKCVSYTDESAISNKKYFEHGDILFAITGESVDEIAKSTAYLGNHKCLAGGDTVILKHREDPKYLSYALSTMAAQRQKSKGRVKSKVVHSSVPEIGKIRIPLPPLPVQREIVRILDTFTGLTAELTAELTARKKQYEYYRELLLTNADEGTVMWMPLKDCLRPIANIRWSVHDQEVYKYVDLTSVDRDLHCIVESRDIDKHTAPSRAQQIIRAGDILLGTTRPLLKRYCLVNSDFDSQICSTGFCVLRANTEVVLPKWILFQVASSAFYEYVEKHQQGASYPSISDTSVKNFLTPIPPLAEQERIVAILDRFDVLCNDLTSGLPAEIEARRKQYEYYRDKLLTFKEKMA